VLYSRQLLLVIHSFCLFIACLFDCPVLQEADAIIDELKDQVDAALGAEEMVEKLTDTNLELEEKLTTMAETVADLEVLRDLSEEQEELRMEVEHDLREELDMSLNSVRLVRTRVSVVHSVLCVYVFECLLLQALQTKHL